MSKEMDVLKQYVDALETGTYEITSVTITPKARAYERAAQLCEEYASEVDAYYELCAELASRIRDLK